MSKMHHFLVGLSFIAGIIECNAMDANWFQTWDREEYQEWAIPIPEGYLIHILRRQEEDYLLARVKLIMGTKGLPGFEVIEERIVPDKQAAMHCLRDWEEASF
jgi:hypothetical protein